MNATALHHDILPALLAGTSRRPLPADHPALDLLSLAGQALRFERPVPPPSFAAEQELKDDRAILADHLRRPLLRLLVTGKATGHAARALARQFDELRMRPHPFDLPHLEAFARSYAERLGPTAQHWVDRQKPASEARHYFDEEPLSDANWTNATLSQRIWFLEERRREDPASARALLESVWAQETADARFRLLQVLETGLTSDDQPFLTSLEKDRAPRVRNLAARLLARLGAGGHNPALQACLGRITARQAGLLQKRTVLHLDVPANLKDDAVSRWVRDTFSDVSVAELTHALSLSEESLIEAAADQGELLLGLAVLATNESRLDLLNKVAALLPDLWERLFASGFDDLGRMTIDQHQTWIELLARPYGNKLPLNILLWDWLHRVADCAAPSSVMSVALQANFLQHLPNLETFGAAWMELFAALCPRSLRQTLREHMSSFDPVLTGNALALIDILDGMETHRTDG